MFSFIRNSKNGYLQGAIFPFNILLKECIHFFRQCRCEKEFGSKKWNLFDYKQSDTLFILGSGGSIASYTEKQWAEIGKHDSVGFNFWLLHEHIPTYFTAEILPDSLRSDVFWQNLEKRAKDYRDIPVIFKYSQAFWDSRNLIPAKLAKTFIASQIVIPGFRKKAFDNWLGWLDWLGVFDKRWSNGLLFYRQASLSWLLTFALQLKYRKIVFCGVDLNSRDYFYELSTDFCESQGLILPPKEFTSATHPSNDAENCRGGLTIVEVLKSMNDLILFEKNLQLFVGAESSALYPAFPCYDWTCSGEK